MVTKISLLPYVGTARKIWGDFGMEKINIAGVQRFFRDEHSDSLAGEKSFMFGKSTSNQIYKSALTAY